MLGPYANSHVCLPVIRGTNYTTCVLDPDTYPDTTPALRLDNSTLDILVLGSPSACLREYHADYEECAWCTPGWTGPSCNESVLAHVLDDMDLRDEQAVRALVGAVARWCPYPEVVATTDTWEGCTLVQPRCGAHGTPNASSTQKSGL